MDTHTIYQQRIDKLNEKLEIEKKKVGKYPYFRLLSIVFGIGVFVLLFKFELIELAWLSLLCALVLFAVAIKREMRFNKEIRRLQALLLINQQELGSLDNDYSPFDGGLEFFDTKHRYTNDLDIFGESSIFRLLNRSTSSPGKTLLANWLLAPAELNEILARQESVDELKDKIEWRQEFRASGLLYKEAAKRPDSILDWLNDEPQFFNKKGLVYATQIVPLLTVIACVGAFFVLPNYVAYLFLGIQASFLWKYKDEINLIYAKTSRQVGLLQSYSALMERIENEAFQAPKLVQLKQKLSAGESSASKSIKQLTSYLNYLDFRLNILVYIPLALLFMWDLQWLIRLEKWKTEHGEEMKKWFDVLAEFEALSSLATVAFNHPNWACPEISKKRVFVSGKELGHPLIPIKDRVTNDVHLSKEGGIMLITGSNMAGKSTYLRTVGVNMVMALAGGTVCAQNFETSVSSPFTSMRIADSLEENTSSFYAELKRLKAVIETVESGENIVFLLDEILRGTNSNDRHVGSRALIKQMIAKKGSGILATHDLELGVLEKEYPEKLENWSFDVQVDDEELFFDYKIHPGICTSLNASILMKKMGINVS